MLPHNRVTLFMYVASMYLKDIPSTEMKGKTEAVTRLMSHPLNSLVLLFFSHFYNKTCSETAFQLFQEPWQKIGTLAGLSAVILQYRLSLTCLEVTQTREARTTHLN